MDDQLLTFVTVVEKKSFSLAARELHVTQPAVTSQIRNLEKYYGVKLLNRDTKFVEVTPAGKVLYDYAKQIITLYQQAQLTLKELGGILRGRLCIGATYTIAEIILPHLIGLFKTDFPDVDVVISVGNREEVYRCLLEGKCDLILVAGDCENRNITCEKWLIDNLVLIVNPEHPWAKRGCISLTELFEERFIMREAGSSLRQYWEKALKDAGLDPDKLNVFIEFSSHTAIKKWVELNFGVSVLSEWVVAQEVKFGLLAKVEIKGLSLSRNINLVYPRYGAHPLTKEFLKFCRRNKDRLSAVLEY
ncbi:MAG: LysR family transcriptional regulator [Thermanaeromonas sp.]|uniref:LysR family transcriptional regulator n=1 Tax=Thermanaeromonas sp. TaxID=2003697 RepID=UPI0024405ECA|nr:LysR family transcriptional regulator [Thermanaeromonas sp.]MCG0277910.1 LysR family transcriptional regulator [Thermanaeromonas sp.]